MQRHNNLKLCFCQFSGQCADDMQKTYAEFCSRHLKAVKLYKELLARDKRFQCFIRVGQHTGCELYWVVILQLDSELCDDYINKLCKVNEFDYIRFNQQRFLIVIFVIHNFIGNFD